MKTAKKEPKAPKTAKVPKPHAMYRKPIPEKKFQRRYLRHIELPKDKALLDAAFEVRDGKRLLKAGLPADQLTRLNILARFIKSNRGFVKTGPLLAVGILVAGVVVFGLFLMNPLLERAAEAGLEAVFGARAEIVGLRFQPFRMRLAYSSLAVADRDKPMSNLFETGQAELRLNPSAMLRGRVYIEEASVATIALGTPRAVSGALPDAPEPPPQAEQTAPDTPPLVDLSRFDAKALIQQEKDKLLCTAAYEEAGTAYNDAVQRWEARAGSSKKAVADAGTSVKAALAIDLGAIKTLDQATAAIATVKTAISQAKTVGTEAKAVSDGIGKDAATLKDLSGATISSVKTDLAYLKGFVTPGSGTAMAALEPSIKAMLSDQGETWLYYGRRALDILGRLRVKAGSGPGDKDKDDDRAVPSPKGRNVYFPGADYPAFRLGRLASEFPAGGAAWSINIRELSTEPDLVPAPSTLDLSMERDSGGRLVVKAQADGRATAALAFSLTASANDLAVELGDALAKAGLAGLTGTLGAEARAQGQSADIWELGADLSLADASVPSPEGTLARAIADALRESESVDAGIRAAQSAGGESEFSLTTSIDTLVGQAVSALAASYAKQATADLEQALGDYVETELDGKLGSKEDFDALLAAAKGDDKAMDSYKKALDDKLKQLEAKVAALGAGALQGIGLPGVSP